MDFAAMPKNYIAPDDYSFAEFEDSGVAMQVNGAVDAKYANKKPNQDLD